MPKKLLGQMKEIFAKMDQGKWKAYKEDDFDNDSLWCIFTTTLPPGLVVAANLSKEDAEGLVFFHNNMREIFDNVVEIL